MTGNLTNWSTDFSKSQERSKTQKLVKARNEYEKGRKVTTIINPDSPRCIILKYE